MKIFAANFKMNKGQAETEKYLSDFKTQFKNARFMVAVPFTSLCATKNAKKWIEIGAQNVHFAPSGAYTGEVSAEMVKEAGASFCIVAHSERRKYFGETDATAAKRAKAAIDAGLDVIFCIGEDLETREKGAFKRKLTTQLRKGLELIEKPEHLIVAYEPVWAIGTGRVADEQTIAETHAHIRKFLNKKYGTFVPILYGGSVSEKNVRGICGTKNVDGVLVGGASLDSNRMKELIENGNK